MLFLIFLGMYKRLRYALPDGKNNKMPQKLQPFVYTLKQSTNQSAVGGA